MSAFIRRQSTNGGNSHEITWGTLARFKYLAYRGAHETNGTPTLRRRARARVDRIDLHVRSRFKSLGGNALR